MEENYKIVEENISVTNLTSYMFKQNWHAYVRMIARKEQKNSHDLILLFSSNCKRQVQSVNFK